MSNNEQLSQVMDLLKEVLTEVKTLSSDMQVVKSDVQDLKSWSRVTDNRLANMENKIVGFATEITHLNEKFDSLDQKVESRLHDTKPIWEAVLKRLDSIESDIATIKENQQKSDKIAEEFRQEVVNRFHQLGKDVSLYRKYAIVDNAQLAKDIISIEERLEKIESKLEIKN